MKIGYMRISKGEQTTALQEDALAKAECEKTFRDVMSGAKDDRPQFLAMLEFARPGDTIVFWRLDRLGRSLRHLIDTVMDLQAREINFLSLTESIDTSSYQFVPHCFSAQCHCFLCSRRVTSFLFFLALLLVLRYTSTIPDLSHRDTSKS